MVSRSIGFVPSPYSCCAALRAGTREINAAQHEYGDGTQHGRNTAVHFPFENGQALKGAGQAASFSVRNLGMTMSPPKPITFDELQRELPLSEWDKRMGYLAAVAAR